MRWWRIARLLVLSWILGVGLWSAFLQIDLAESLAVAVAGAAVLAVALYPTAPWWRGRTQLEALTTDQRKSLARQDWVLIAGLLGIAVVVSIAIAALWPGRA